MSAYVLERPSQAGYRNNRPEQRTFVSLGHMSLPAPIEIPQLAPLGTTSVADDLAERGSCFFNGPNDEGMAVPRASG